jgi:hypothetical protein
MILEAAGLNYTLTSRKVALDWSKPLTLVAKAAKLTSWSGLVEDVRTAIWNGETAVGRFWPALHAMHGIVAEGVETA